MLSVLKFIFLFLLIYAIISFIRFILTINKTIKANTRQGNPQPHGSHKNRDKVIELNEDQYKVE